MLVHRLLQLIGCCATTGITALGEISLRTALCKTGDFAQVYFFSGSLCLFLSLRASQQTLTAKMYRQNLRNRICTFDEVASALVMVQLGLVTETYCITVCFLFYSYNSSMLYSWPEGYES